MADLLDHTQDLAPGMHVLLPQCADLYDRSFGLATSYKILALLLA